MWYILLILIVDFISTEVILKEDNTIIPQNSDSQGFITVPLQKYTNPEFDKYLAFLIQSRSINLINYDTTQYIGEIAIGSSNSRFSMIFDTGSSNTWIYGECASSDSDCTIDACSRHRRFNKKSSATFVENGTVIEITYGSGTVRGSLFQDTLKLGKCDASDLSCEQVNDFFFLGASCISGDTDGIFHVSRFDGVMGLGPSTLSIDGTKTILQSLADSGKIQQSQRFFTFFLTPNANQGGSVFSIGKIDQSLFTGSIVYHKLIDNYPHWGLRLGKICVGKTCIVDCEIQQCAVVPDTGTSLISGPQILVDRLHSLIGDVDEGCKNLQNLPTLRFYIDDHEYLLTGSEYVFQIQDGGQLSCGHGIFGMEMPPSFGSMWILGDLFLKKYFSVFDVDKNRIGFALAAKK